VGVIRCEEVIRFGDAFVAFLTEFLKGLGIDEFFELGLKLFLWGFLDIGTKKIDFIVIQRCETWGGFHFDTGRAAKPLGTGETGKRGRQTLETFGMCL
jgi:hypothetical protein